MSCIGRVALSEPLVDCVDAGQINSNPCLLKTFDIKTMTKEDVAFVVRRSVWGVGRRRVGFLGGGREGGERRMADGRDG